MEITIPVLLGLSVNITLLASCFAGVVWGYATLTTAVKDIKLDIQEIKRDEKRLSACEQNIVEIRTRCRERHELLGRS